MAIFDSYVMLPEGHIIRFPFIFHLDYIVQYVPVIWPLIFVIHGASWGYATETKPQGQVNICKSSNFDTEPLPYNACGNGFHKGPRKHPADLHRKRMARAIDYHVLSISNPRVWQHGTPKWIGSNILLSNIQQKYVAWFRQMFAVKILNSRFFPLPCPALARALALPGEPTSETGSQGHSPPQGLCRNNSVVSTFHNMEFKFKYKTWTWKIIWICKWKF